MEEDSLRTGTPFELANIDARRAAALGCKAEVEAEALARVPTTLAPLGSSSPVAEADDA